MKCRCLPKIAFRQNELDPATANLCSLNRLCPKYRCVPTIAIRLH